MNPTDSITRTAADTANDLTWRAARTADQALAATLRGAADATRSLREGVDTLHNQTGSALTRAAAQAEALSRDGLERARRASEAARAQAQRMGDQTVGYIKDEPVKAVAIAAGVGALAALLVGWLGRSRRDHGTAR
jgi:ElaB/YqjD/DUF883 family membrane-anchored ribosome-binding protein